MILGSHNSWSYLRPKYWCLIPFSFTARCQNIDIKNQYFFYNVRCFDLRINFDKNGKLFLCHGGMRYKYTEEQLLKDLSFLNNRSNTCYIRILFDVRSKRGYTDEKVKLFREKCAEYKEMFPRLVFWCGRNLYNWKVDYEFDYKPVCEEKYSSVCPPKYIDDWFPWLYASLNNGKIREMKKNDQNVDILLLDFVNID